MGNLASLVGRAAGFANALVRKYDAGGVPDIVDYLRAEWATAAFHDRFGALALRLRGLVEGDAAAAELLARVEAAMRPAAAASDEADRAVERLRAAGIGVCGAHLAPGLRRTIEHAVLDFLREHHHILPGFHVPPVKPQA